MSLKGKHFYCIIKEFEGSDEDGSNNYFMNPYCGVVYEVYGDYALVSLLSIECSDSIEKYVVNNYTTGGYPIFIIKPISEMTLWKFFLNDIDLNRYLKEEVYNDPS